MSDTTLTDPAHNTLPPDLHDLPDVHDVPELHDVSDELMDLGAAAWLTAEGAADAAAVSTIVGGVLASSWSHVPVDDRYDTPVPFTAPAWLQVSRAEEYDDYDAAIPFHVVDAYTQHMTDDGDSLDL